MATAWNDMPVSVILAVADQVGPVQPVRDVSSGENNDLAAVLQAGSRRVFVKGVRGVRSIRMRRLRTEAAVAPLTGGLAPAVLFAVDVDDWLVVGFEYVAGRRANLGPGSGDLARVASAVNQLAELPAPDLVRPLRKRWAPVDWWPRLAAVMPEAVERWNVPRLERWCSRVPELVDGDRLVHTDLHGDQFLLDDAGAVPHVVDWAFPGAGAPWVDSAFVVLRMVGSGHGLDAAEKWARRSLRPFAAAEDDAITAWAVYLAGMWSVWAATEAAPGQAYRAELARRYAWWRLHAVDSRDEWRYAEYKRPARLWRRIAAKAKRR